MRLSQIGGTCGPRQPGPGLILGAGRGRVERETGASRAAMIDFFANPGKVGGVERTIPGRPHRRSRRRGAPPNVREIEAMTFLDVALWAQQGGFGTRPAPQAPSTGQILLPIIGGLVCGLLVAIPLIIAQWRIFTKAGEPGWASLVPIYNGMILSKICGRGEMFGLLLLVPCVNIVISIMLMFDLARVFGKGPGFAVGLLLLSPIFILM